MFVDVAAAAGGTSDADQGFTVTPEVIKKQNTSHRRDNSSQNLNLATQNPQKTGKKRNNSHPESAPTPPVRGVSRHHSERSARDEPSKPPKRRRMSQGSSGVQPSPGNSSISSQVSLTFMVRMMS